MWEWLLTSIDPSRAHDVGFEVSMHGRLMVLGWSFLVPIGILSARFFKIMPRQQWPQKRDNQFWWFTHLTMQYTAGVLMLMAIWLIWPISGKYENSFLHHLMGWTTVTLCSVQYLAGWLRGTKGGPTELAKTGTIRGDHFDMTPRRKAFEYIHKTAGYVCLTAAIIAVFSGMWMTNAPNWMWIILIAWWVFIIALFFNLQRTIGAIETYEAIWGDDPTLPGNQLKPIGLGTKRRNGSPSANR
ncbi:MAG: cytochrome b561 domain-containing protein [Ahrensia sp.]|nr:cytochrome b561 domain-containing protein [Ahrensia sp.]